MSFFTKCRRCNQIVYPGEKIEANGVYHKGCFVCSYADCKVQLTLSSFHSYEKEPYCSKHVPKAMFPGKKPTSSPTPNIKPVVKEESSSSYNIPKQEYISEASSNHNEKDIVAEEGNLGESKSNNETEITESDESCNSEEAEVGISATAINQSFDDLSPSHEASEHDFGCGSCCKDDCLESDLEEIELPDDESVITNEVLDGNSQKLGNDDSSNEPAA